MQHAVCITNVISIASGSFATIASHKLIIVRLITVIETNDCLLVTK